MKKITLMIYVLIAIALILIIGLKKDFDVTKGQWKYAEGRGHIGDWIEFDGSLYRLASDTIYKNNQAVAIIMRARKKEMRIRNIISQGEADYTNHAE